MKIKTLIPLLLLLSGLTLHAAEKKDGEADPTEKKTGIAKLLKKLTDKEGKPVPIAVLTPLDYTTLGFVQLARETIVESIQRYGQFDIRNIEYAPKSLTLEEFRRIVTKHKVEVIVLCVLKPTNFDLFIYDRRTPYNIYAHSEVLPEAVQYQLSQEVVEEFTKIIVRRSLYAYLQDQAFELPREEAQALLGVEVPRWIASNRSLAMVNKEIMSNLYFTGGVGAAVMSGQGKQWNSNIIALEIGYRLTDDIFAEFNVDLSAYNTIAIGAKKVVSNRDSPFRYTFGLAVGQAQNTKTLNWDQNYTQGLANMYVIPSAGLIFPIVEVHFKVETKIFYSLTSGGFIFAAIPGLFFFF